MLAEMMVGGWSITQIAIAIVIIAGICALVFVALRAMGVQLPQWFITVLLIVLVVIVVCVAIKFVGSLF